MCFCGLGAGDRLGACAEGKPHQFDHQFQPCDRSKTPMLHILRNVVDWDDYSVSHLVSKLNISVKLHPRPESISCTTRTTRSCALPLLTIIP